MPEPMTRRQRMERIKKTAAGLTRMIAGRYDSLSSEKKNELHDRLNVLDDKYTAYLEGEESWDSRLIDVAESVPNGPKFTVKGVSTFESVMDHVRDVACLAVSAK